jgi:hypothetical protein
LYIESTNVANDHVNGVLNDYLGLLFIHDGSDDEVVTLYGADQTITEQKEMNYFGGTDAHYSVDRMDTFSGEMLFSCENDFGRMILNEGESYKAVSSSVILGAMANGYSLNLKPYLIGEIVNYFLGYNPPTAINDALPSNKDINIYPNPFSSQTTISFHVENPGIVKVEILNSTGQTVRTLSDDYRSSGNYSVIWDAKDGTGINIAAGIYYYRVNEKDRINTGKLMLIR